MTEDRRLQQVKREAFRAAQEPPDTEAISISHITPQYINYTGVAEDIDNQVYFPPDDGMEGKPPRT